MRSNEQAQPGVKLNQQTWASAKGGRDPSRLEGSGQQQSAGHSQRGKADGQQELLYGPGRPELLTFQEKPETQVLIGILFLNISN